MHVTHLIPETSLGNEEPIRLVQVAQKRQIWCFVHRFAVAMFPTVVSRHVKVDSPRAGPHIEKAWRQARG